MATPDYIFSSPSKIFELFFEVLTFIFRDLLIIGCLFPVGFHLAGLKVTREPEARTTLDYVLRWYDTVEAVETRFSIFELLKRFVA